MERAQISPDDSPAASRRRGACPTIAAPMPTGDGLLARLRPVENAVSPQQLIALAEAASSFGNGMLDVTARGSLQVRGLRPDTVAAFAGAALATGIEISTGIAIETPPLSGHDPSEMADARVLARELRAAVADASAHRVFAPKLSITVDGGGVFNLGAVTADIRLQAVEMTGAVGWMMSLGGSATTARPVAMLTGRDVCPAVLAVLDALAAIGPDARGRDLDVAGVRAQFPGDRNLSMPVASARSPVPAGCHDMGRDGFAAGVVPAYYQIESGRLSAFARAAQAAGSEEIMLSPGHGLLVPGLSRQAAEDLLAFAAGQGFRVSPQDPGNHIVPCVGSRGCASGFFDTRATAGALVEAAPELLDGSLMLHLSGCAKGCAHPGVADITIAGASSGYAFVANGTASASPDAYIAANDVVYACARLATLVRDNKTAGETARACLARLGVQRVAGAARQG